MSKKREVALFDFDGTISFKDSFIEFIKYTDGRLKLLMCIFLNAPFIVLYLLKIYPNQNLKERFFTFFYKGVSVSELEEKGKSFSLNELPKFVYPEAIQLITQHKAKGRQVYLLTASSNIWLGTWCRQNEIGFIGTEFEHINQKYTGKIAGKNCYGEEKINRIRFILDDEQIAEVFGYGNGKADSFFLSKMKHSFNMPLNKENQKEFMIDKGV